MCLGADESLDLLLQRGIPVGDELVNQALDREAGIASPGVEVCSASVRSTKWPRRGRTVGILLARTGDNNTRTSTLSLRPIRADVVQNTIQRIRRLGRQPRVQRGCCSPHWARAGRVCDLSGSQPAQGGRDQLQRGEKGQLRHGSCRLGSRGECVGRQGRGRD